MFKRLVLTLLSGVLGLAILAGLLLATVPARVMIPVIDPGETLQLRQVQGTLWRGSARLQPPGRQPLQAEWQWAPPLAWGWQIHGDEVDLGGTALPAFDRSLEVRDVTGTVGAGRLDIDAWLPNVVPGGDFVLDIGHIRRDQSGITGLAGTVTWYSARLHGAIEESLGTVEIRLNPGETGFEAAIDSLEPAPVTVRGRLVIDGGRYEADLWLRAERDRPDLARQLARLGEVQPDGQVRLRQTGRFF